MVKTRPILFSAPMVRAILGNRKTMTRRLVKPTPKDDGAILGFRPITEDNPTSTQPKWLYNGQEFKCPYGKAGDHLWVRETHLPYFEDVHIIGDLWGKKKEPMLFYKASHSQSDLPAEYAQGLEKFKWIPSIHMKRVYSRILLEVTDVRVERLQDISQDDARAEGVDMRSRPALINGEQGIYYPIQASHEFACLWNRIHGVDQPTSWNENPWVWAVSFKVLEVKS